MPLETGRVLNNRYRIVSRLGQGGFGAVYRAWDLNLKRPCAVKENLETNPESQQQFENEATVLANLYHQHLPRVTDHFVLPNQGQYLVMDFVQGQDLEEMVKNAGTIPIKQAIEWISQIADALDYLHSQKRPVIHRDIKPANIRVAPDGRAYLVDFGLVKLYENQAFTTPGARGMTPGFSPPEQYGQGGTNARSDIYALAATLYTLLTGIVPPESVHRYAQVHLQPAHKLNSNIPHSLSAVIDKAMSLDPNNRYQSVKDFKDALRKALFSFSDEDTLISHRKLQPVVAPLEGGRVVAPSLLQKPIEGAIHPEIKSPVSTLKQRKLLIAGTGVLFVIICASLIYALGFFLDKPDEEIDTKATHARFTEVAMLAADTLTAQAWDTEPNSVETTDVPESNIPSTPTAFIPPPDESTVTSIPSPTPTPVDTLTPTPVEPIYDLAFASDKDGEFAVYLMDSNTKGVKKIPRPSGYERVWWPSFCGDSVAVEAQDLDSNNQWVYLINIFTGNDNRLSAPETSLKLGVPRCSPSGEYLAYSANYSENFWAMFVTDFSNTYQYYPTDGQISGYASWPLSGTNFLFQVITQEDYKNMIYRIVDYPSVEGYTIVGGGANPALSPDGSRMVYSCKSNGNDRTLCVADANGSNEVELIDIIRIQVPGIGWGIQPASAWSADGKWVYFASAVDGDWDIYRIRPNGADIENLTNDWGSSNEVNPAVKW